ncbi:uncharacterized protein LOC121260440 isoform X3 [Juglans microcarpa x Juglans regia]|uniref:uncharacterized protein LOC121260440 isoform X3 n=1 Tax=Juglans microcarpa x Juglans regia TaxID=2249226 RepID=UPI001B7EE7DF|nr:uncharacterized protein LOC121260440 isoform X3 [Juglans microcarpa x Juglans regia]
MRKLTLRDKPANSSSNDKPEVYSSPKLPVFEYFEQEQPHHRQPLYDKSCSCTGVMIFCLQVGFLWLGAGKNQSKFHASSGRKVDGNEPSSKISLPLFGLASYKLRAHNGDDGGLDFKCSSIWA